MSSAPTEDPKSWRQTKRWFRDHPELGKPGEIPTGPMMSEEYYQRERKLLWPHVWLMVGRVEEIPEAGQFFIKDIPTCDATLIVVRGRDGKIRSFHNVCTHRGAAICWEKSGEKGKVNAFACPYHGFTFDLEGKLSWVPDEENFYDLKKEELGLKSVLTDIWEGFIFIHMDPNPRETLKEYLGEIGTGLTDYPFQDTPYFYEYKAVVRRNWKVLMGGFLENYHTQALHAGARTRAVTNENPYSHNFDIKLHDKHRWISLYRSPDQKPTKAGEIAFRAGRSSKDASVVNSDKWWKLHKSFNINNIFPNFQLNVVNGAWFRHLFWPLGVDSVLWESRMYYPKAKNASERFFQEYARVASRDIMLEDGNVSERSQAGLKSGAITKWVLQDEEVAIQHFNKVVADYAGPWTSEMSR